MAPHMMPDPDELADSGLDMANERLRAWLRRLVARRLDPFPPELREVMLEDLCGQPDRLLRWKDFEEYRGDGFACGSWTLDADALDAAAREAIEPARRQLEERAYPTLDTWLAALHEGRLRSLPPDEPDARRWIRDPSKRARRCVDCGEPFMFEERRPRAKRCPVCREGQRTAVEVREWGGNALGTLLRQSLGEDATWSDAAAALAKVGFEHGSPDTVRDLCRGLTRRLRHYAPALATVCGLPSATYILALYQVESRWPPAEVEAIWAAFEARGLIKEDAPDSESGSEMVDPADHAEE